MRFPEFTIGIEEEYQIIDPESRQLTSYVQEMLEEGRLVLQEQIKPEFLRSQIEVGSKICTSIAEARDELIRLRRTVSEVAEAHGLVIAAASTHPFSSWMEQEITAADRYSQHAQRMAEVARRMLIFGMHVHVGIEDKELLIDVMDQARYFMPHLLALSTSSPFWHGRDTGLCSYRSVVFGSMPRSGPPPAFGSWAEYTDFVDTLVKTGSIDDGSFIWWDMRPHNKFPTLEIRVCDICTRVDEAIAVAALIVALIAKLALLRRDNRSWRRYGNALVLENKWRAIRYGIGGDLIDYGKKEEVPMRTLAEEMLELVDDVLDPLGVRREVEQVRTILERGTSADRQRATFEETGSLQAVVDRMIAETKDAWS